jgi:class 3 adenylate cyclase
MKRGFQIFIITLLLFSVGCSNANKTRPLAYKGYLDLSGRDFDRNGIITLDGTWAFYWNRLYTPDDFEKDTLDANPYYLRVPGVWNSLVVDNQRLTGSGFGTYYLKIKLNHVYDYLGIKLLDCSSSYKLWVNRELVATNGQVSSILSEIVPQMQYQVKTFHVDSDQLVLVVQVANNFHYKGGMWESIRIGTQEQIISANNKSLIISMFFAGTLFILFIYHIWIYLFRRNEKAALWFGVLCFIVLFRTLQINERVIYYIFPGLNLDFSYRLQYLAIFSLIPLPFTLYFSYLFEQSVSRKVIYIIGFISFLELIIILFSPSRFYTSCNIIFQILLYSVFIYFFILTFKQLDRRPEISRLLIISWIIILISGLNDILYLNMIINTTQIAHYAFFIFLVVQAYILSYKIAGAFHAIEDLSVNLERKVAERTRELAEEKKKSDNLLLNILPAEVARELKLSGRSEAKTYSMVTVMFTDFKDFTRVSEKESAELLVAEIDYCFSAFDNIIQKYGIEKIKTVGDAYLCAGGLPALTYTHAQDTVNAAIEIRDFILARKIEKESRAEIPFEVRIGVHTGPVVAGIVGVKKFAYDIWGDTVNIAARMESGSEAGKVNISGTTYELVKDYFTCTYRGKVEAKNKGEVDMYFAERI